MQKILLCKPLRLSPPCALRTYIIESFRKNAPQRKHFYLCYNYFIKYNFKNKLPFRRIL